MAVETRTLPPRWWLHPLLAFLLTRLILLGGGYLLDLRFANDPAAPWENYPDGAFLDVWTRWDGEWYLSIARDGYTYDPASGLSEMSNVAFFPTYPLLIRLVSPLLGNNDILAGVLLSHLCFLAGLLLLYRLTALEFDDESAGRVVYYTAVFPMAVFFSAVYSESLFFLLTVAAVYAARRRWWLLAGLAGALAGATRIIGMLIVLPVALEWARLHGWTLAQFRRGAAWRGLLAGARRDALVLLCIALIPLGLLLHMIYLGHTFGNPLLFADIMGAEGWNRDTGQNPLVVIAANLVFIAQQFGGAADPSQLDWYIWLKPIDIGFALFFLAVGVFVWRRLGAGYGLYTLLGVLIPLTSGNVSQARYVLVLFPVYMLLARWGRHPIVDRAVLVGGSLLLGMFTVFYVNWVFIG